MHSLKSILFTAALGFIVAGLPEAASAQDIQVSPYEVEDLTYPDMPDIQIPDVERVEFDNGLTVFLIEDHELPTISAQARVGVGSVYEPADLVGLSTVTGTVMRTGGTAEMSPDEVNQTLENVGATVETFISETSGGAFMTTLEENLDTVLPIFVDVLARPAFAEEKVELAKTRQRSSIARRNDNPQGVAFREFSQLLYGEESPYARIPEYWTIDAIDRQSVVDFHERFFHPNNTLLSVWGDFETEAMIEKLRSAFGDWERADGFELPPLPEKEGEMEYSVHFIPKSDVTQSIVLMGYPGNITRRSPDYVPVTVMNQVLSGGFTSRLFQSVRSDQGLAYAVFGSYGAGYEQPGQFYAGVFSKSGSTIEAAQSVMHEIDRLRDAPPSDEEVALAKDSYLNSFVFNFDSRREIVQRLMTYDYYGYPRDFLQQVQSGVENVSPQDVYRVSQKYLHPDRVDLLVLGNDDDFSEPLATLAGDGAVETIDISIPSAPPADSGDETNEDQAQSAAPDGREMLLDAAEAMGGVEAFESIDNIRMVSQQLAQSPMGEVNITVNSLMAGPERMHIVRETPMGSMEVIVNEENAQVITPRGSQSLPASARSAIEQQVWYELSHLMAHADDEELDVRDLGMEEVEGTELAKLAITPPGTQEAFNLFLDPESNLPQRMTYTARSMQGQMQETTQVYSDYREAGPVMLPYETVVFQNGEQAAVTNVQEVTINADLAEDAFAID